MELVQLTVDARVETGKGPARRLRAGGAIPGVVYGLKRNTLHLAVDSAVFSRLFGGSDTNVLIDLDVPGEDKESSVAAMIKEVQRDPVTREPLNIDFQWVSLTEQIEVEVPLEITGTAPGVEEDGGVVQQQLHTVALTCLPTVIPASIVVDITGMSIGDARFVSDLPVVEGISYVPEADEVVLTIAAPISEEDLETQIDDELLDSLVDLEVGEELEEGEVLAPEDEEGPEATEGAQVDVQEIGDDEDVLK